MVNYFFAQSIKEINYIIKRTKKNIFCIPLNLEQVLFCQKKKIKFINLSKILNNKVHEKCILGSKYIVDCLELKKINEENLKLDIKGIIRFRVNLIIFILEILNQINKKEKINIVFFSGWREKNPSNLNYYFLHYVEKIVSKSYKTVSLSKKIVKNKNSLSTYKFINVDNIRNDKKNILLNNLGYNFKRFVLNNIKREHRYYFFSFAKH